MALREHEATPATEDEPVDDSPHTVVTVAEPAAPPPASYPWDKALGWVDRQQVRIPPVAFGGAVLKKAGEDQVTLLAAVMSHFGMLSMFPLLLLLVTVAGYVFHDDDAAQQAIIDAAINNFPVLGDYLRASVQALPGSGVALLFGFVLLLWASLRRTRSGGGTRGRTPASTAGWRR